MKSIMRSWQASIVFIVVACPCAANASSDYSSLLQLAEEWRRFEQPVMSRCVPDYGAEAMKVKAGALPALRARLDDMDTHDWSPTQRVDHRLIEAEMSGLDFDLRVRRPWARDPSFYATVFGERSDVPQHEGVTAAPVIDLFAYQYPLSRADQRSLTCLLGAIPALLDQAKINLHDSNAHDLWTYSVATLRDQGDVLAHLQAGTLDMRTLEGSKHASLAGADKALLAATEQARTATEAFVEWIDSEAPNKTGPSGVGKDNYNWYMQKVHLVPYDWDQQVTLAAAGTGTGPGGPRARGVSKPCVAAAGACQYTRDLARAGRVADAKAHRFSHRLRHRRGSCLLSRCDGAAGEQIRAAGQAEFLRPCDRARAAGPVLP